MKFFAIGDGHKRVSLPDRYETEITPDGTSIFWAPETDGDIPIRVSVLTIESKDKNENEAAFWAVIHKANREKNEPTVVDDKAIFQQREFLKEENEINYFYEIGMGNCLIVVSVSVEEKIEQSADFQKVRDEVDAMIATIEQREDDHPFICELPGSDFDEIAEAVEELLPTGLKDSSWDSLQKHYDESLQNQNLQLAGKVGLTFGEMIKKDIPGFNWYLTIDDWGCARSLNFEESGISIFPENMIIKRVDDDHAIDLKEFASDTIETVEEILRTQ